LPGGGSGKWLTVYKKMNSPRYFAGGDQIRILYKNPDGSIPKIDFDKKKRGIPG